MFENFSKEKKTTVLGIVQIVLFALVSFNLITAEESTEVAAATNTVVDSLGGGWVVTIGTILSATGGVFLMFAKDPGSGKKKSE